MTLLAQWESASDELGRSYGLTIHKDGGIYVLRTHIRTWDGVRVASSWASEPTALSAKTRDSALAEGWTKFQTWLRTLIRTEAAQRLLRSTIGRTA